MKNKIAVNAKFFKRANASGEIGHVMRNYAVNKNVISRKLSENNFTVGDIKKNYYKSLKLMPASVQNTLIDTMLMIPLEQLTVMQSEHPDWRKKLAASIKEIMLDMEQETGLRPLGFEFHLDEGHYKNGELVLNPHAHLMFANICTKDITIEKNKKITLKGSDGKALKDPKKPSKYLYELDDTGNPKSETIKIPLKGRCPLSLHQSRGSDSVWSRQQDIAAKHLAIYGFERGTSKEITNAIHLSKEEHVKRELAKSEQIIEANKLIIGVQEQRIIDIKNEMEMSRDRVSEFIFSREAFINSVINNVMEDPTLLAEAVSRFREIPVSMRVDVLDNTMNRVGAVSSAFEFDDSEQTRELEKLINNMKEKKVESVPSSLVRPRR